MNQQLEVADIFRAHGSAWRKAHVGHISLGQLKVMSAIERCRCAELGGHKLHCKNCETIQIAYNSCRNRHCPKCQSTVAYRWLDARQKDLINVDYYHAVFTVPPLIRDMMFQNKPVMYNILFKAASKTLLTLAADPKHLGALIGMIMVLHTWGSAMTFHPHVHCIIPGGGLSTNKEHWIDCKPGFFLSVRVLSRLFRRLFIEMLTEAYLAKELTFFGKLSTFKNEKAFSAGLKLEKDKEWVVYAKRPFSGPEAVLAYLSRYTHRVAIANSRLDSMNEEGVSFKWKDYRKNGRSRFKTMTLTHDEFIRRFLIHVLPRGFHRIRHYGILANTVRKENFARVREHLALERPEPITNPADALEEQIECTFVCPTCSSPMDIIEIFGQNYLSRAPPRKNNYHE